MIHKIERLVSIGKFRDYQASGDVAFRKLTLFYGDNGSGKTTLTAILRSLTLNRPEIVNRRKSTNQAAIQQAVQIIGRNAAGNFFHTLHHATGWTSAYPDIEIFDIHFINENIYSGFDFNDEHKKKLHQFVIGAQGVTIRQQIEQNKADKTASRQVQSNLEQQLLQQVGSNLTSGLISSFLTILPSQATGVDQQITLAEAALASANANATIQTLQNLTALSRINPSFNFVEASADLQTTSQTIQSNVLQDLFTNHCSDLASNTISTPENWLHAGFGYLRSKGAAQLETPVALTCPFCKQPIGEIEIISAYALKFDSAFNSLVQRMQGHLAALQNFNLDLKCQALNNAKETNAGHVASWTSHLPSTVLTPSTDIATDEATLKSAFQALTEAVQLKLQNPSAAVDATRVTNFQTTLQTINTKIDQYNQAITVYNVSITSFRASIQSVPNAQLSLDTLRRVKKRVEQPIDSLCSQLSTERQTLRSLETAYPLLIQQQETAAAAFFSSYKARINYYLGTVFKTLFRIDNVVNVPPQGLATQSKIEYKLMIDGQDISFDSAQPYNAKDCLSEGDKSTIALAFFLSKLDIDPGLNNKILVFDDPLSSFDSNRRMYTIQLIRDLFPNIEQTIVLSHSELFLHELSKGFAPGDRKALRITENFVTKASFIEPLDLEVLVENDYFKHIKELENFLQNPDISKKEIVLGRLRNVLEAHLRFKFYRQLSGLPQNGQTLGTIISTLVTQGVVFRDNVNRQVIISKLNLLNGISCRPHHGEPIPDYVTLGVNPNSMTVTELSNFITDTLGLVDNEL